MSKRFNNNYMINQTLEKPAIQDYNIISNNLTNVMSNFETIKNSNSHTQKDKEYCTLETQMKDINKSMENFSNHVRLKNRYGNDLNVVIGVSPSREKESETKS